ncbi:MAG: hypothetical protein CMA27_01310 [Euryarchaeota archaeon]|nr:hypothetical protein [Euryarchaeota archaeon]
MQLNSISTKVGGHVTLLFSIQSNNEDLDQQGSRGAGLCVEKGVEVNTTIVKGDGSIKVISNENNLSSKLYHLVIEQIGERHKIVYEYNWTFEIKTDLPFGQGFGCSAAGALGAIISVLKLINETEDIYQNSLTMAHRIERKMSSGLGDVVALGAGGIELRLEPGLPFPPNNGKILSWDECFPVLLCWVQNQEKHTSEYIDNEDWKIKISSAGERCISKLNRKVWDKFTWKNLLIQADLFCKNSGMLNDSNRKNIINNIETILKEKGIDLFWNTKLCMLGSSAVIVPTNLDNYDEKELDYVLEKIKEIGLNGCITKINSNPII